MAGVIKGITIKLGADATELTTSLRETNSNLAKTQAQLNNVNKALKFNPSNVELLTQKEELLTRKINDTKSSIDNMKKSLAMMDEKGIDKTSDEYMELQRAIIESESKLKSFNNELKQTQRLSSNVGQLATKFENVGSKITELGNKLRAVSLAAGAVSGALVGISVKAGKTADDINTLSTQYGIGTDQLQLYAQASDLVDVSVEAIAKSQSKMKKSMLTAQQGSKNTAEAFHKLGVEIENSDGSLRSQDEVFQEVLASLGSMTNETERDAYAMQIFGRSAAELNPMIEDMGRTYKTVVDTFKSNGIEILDQETLDQANRFNDAIDTIKATVGQAVLVIGSKLAGELAPIMEKIGATISKIAGKIANMNPTLLAVVTAITGIIAGLAPVLILGGKLISGVGRAIKTFQSLFAVLSANPIILVVAGITALVAGLVTAYNKSESFRNIVNKVGSTLKSFITTITNTAKKITTTLSNAFDKVKTIGSNIVTGLWNGIKFKTSWIIGKIKEFTNGIKDKLKSFFGISSPSKWARDMIGKNISLGVAQGINENSFVVNKSMKNVVPDMRNVAGNVNSSNVYNFGNITLDAHDLNDVMTVQGFVELMRKQKAYV